MSYRRLLVPLDGSEFSEFALPLALAVAERSGASIELTAVHEPMLPPGLIEDVGGVDSATLGALMPAGERLDAAAWEALEKRLSDYLEDAASRVRDRFDGTVTTTVLDGWPVEELDQRIHEADADLVVMTTHGRGGLSRAWLGSVADGLVRCCGRPVLLTRPHETDVPDLDARNELERVLVPLDGSELAESILDDVVTLCRVTGAACALLGVIIPPLEPGSPYLAQVSDVFDRLLEEAELRTGEYLDGVAQTLRDRGLAVETHSVVHVQPHGAILGVAEQSGADLIAMATHGRSGVRRMLLGSVGDKVLRSAEVPVLLRRPPEEDD